MTAFKRLLITGATGKQGGAVISALLANPPKEPFELVALTRNANSQRAQALAKQPNVSILEGDLDNIAAVFRQSSHPFHGVFSVQVPLDVKKEEEQGTSLIDAAASNGVSHFIYTSADRGGDAKSNVSGSPIAHFQSKFRIEHHLKAVAEKTTTTQPHPMHWTIIRPVAFMENLTPDFLGRAFTAMWRLNGSSTKLQLVSALDVGVLAAEAFTRPEEYSNRSVSLATDELSPDEADEIFQRVVGEALPTTYPFVGRLVKVVLRKQLGVMFDWFKTDGFGADPREFMVMGLPMRDFETWLRRDSAFRVES